MIRTNRQYQRVLHFADGHCPYLDQEAWSVMIEFIIWWKPSVIVNHGDWMDFEQISKFDCNPRHKMRIAEDIAFAIERQSELRKCAPKATIHFVEGNHDARLQKWLWRHEEVANIEALKVENLLLLEKFKIQWTPCLEDLVVAGVLCEHGDRCSQHSAYAARAMLDTRGVTGMSGHTHRYGLHCKRNRHGQIEWYELGCMCQMHPHYTKHPNWQQGFTIRYTDGVRHEVHRIDTAGNAVTFNNVEFTGMREELNEPK